jgi:uncharacterized damage-inducible protein DinB
LDEAAAEARSALESTTDDHLQTNWKLLARGNVVWEGTRIEMIQDTFNHWCHHRGQMTVYLRLMGAKVPALYWTIRRRSGILATDYTDQSKDLIQPPST